MPHPDLAVVTGAFSYTGRYVTRRLLDQGVRVRTLTRNPDAENPLVAGRGGRPWTSPRSLWKLLPHPSREPNGTAQYRLLRIR